MSRPEGELIATVVRLQVQSSPLKGRPAGSGPYDPRPLLEVAALEVGPTGCTGLTGGPAPRRVIDVHSAEHPQSRQVRGVNGLSVLPTAHYAALRQRYGPHLVDGVAGENLLLECGPLTVADLSGTLLLEADQGLLELTGALAAAPCVEFTQFVLGRKTGDTGPELLAGLDDLDHGVRGFYLRVAGTGTVRAGARLLRSCAPDREATRPR